MFISQVQMVTIIIVPLIFVGIHRAIANPSNVSNLLEITTTEEPKKHDVPGAIEGKEHQWECNEESNHLPEKIKFTTGLMRSLSEGLKKEVQNFSADEHENFFQALFFEKKLYPITLKEVMEESSKYNGPLENMTLVIENYSASLTRRVIEMFPVQMKNLNYDFTFTSEARSYIDCLCKLISENYKENINSFVLEIIQNYGVKDMHGMKYDDDSIRMSIISVDKKLSELVSLYNTLRELSKNLVETTDYKTFFENMFNFQINQRTMYLENKLNESIRDLWTERTTIRILADERMVFNPNSWIESSIHWVELIKNELELYDNFKQYAGIMLDEFYSLENKFYGWGDWYNGLDEKRKQRIYNLISRGDEKKKMLITCDSNGTLVVRGFWIQLSDIDSNLVDSHCEDYVILKEVVLLAVDTVFFDGVQNNTFEGVNLFIAAPKWKVDPGFEQQKVVLSARSGPGPDLVWCDCPYTDNGKDGKPGLPGYNGGSFFGIGLYFSNGHKLLIESNGGKGGPGVNGAKGEKGADGCDAYQKFESGKYKETSQSINFTEGINTVHLSNALSPHAKHGEKPFYIGDGFRCCSCCAHYLIAFELIKEDGDCGGLGGPGGMGGEGGMGGFAGDLQLVELGNSSQIALKSQNGSKGDRGEMGEPGDRGKDGIGMICVKVDGFYYNSSIRAKTYWKCDPTNIFSPTCNPCSEKNQSKVEKYTTTDMKQPEPKNSLDFSVYLQEYAALLKTLSKHPFYKQTIAEFNEAIQKKFSSNLVQFD